MKKMKKLAALVLALAMSFSLMAVTAAAYGAERHVHDETCAADTIQPRLPTKLCPKCRAGMAVYKQGTDTGGRYVLFRCENPDCTFGELVKVYW